jgi:hypothetical protein
MTMPMPAPNIICMVTQGINLHYHPQMAQNVLALSKYMALVPNFKESLKDFGDDFESIMDLINLISQCFSI